MVLGAARLLQAVSDLVGPSRVGSILSDADYDNHAAVLGVDPRDAAIEAQEAAEDSESQSSAAGRKHADTDAGDKTGGGLELAISLADLAHLARGADPGELNSVKQARAGDRAGSASVLGDLSSSGVSHGGAGRKRAQRSAGTAHSMGVGDEDEDDDDDDNRGANSRGGRSYASHGGAATTNRDAVVAENGRLRFKAPFELPDARTPHPPPILVEAEGIAQLRLLAGAVQCSAALSCSSIRFQGAEASLAVLHAGLLQIAGASGSGVESAEKPARVAFEKL